MNGWMILLAGATTGAGVALLIGTLLPTRPDLHSALERLDSRVVDLVIVPESSGHPFLDQLRQRVLPQLAQGLGLRRFAADLHAVGQTPEDLALRKVGYALGGLVAPVLFAAALSLAGLGLPIAVPGLVGVILGAVLFFVPDLDLRQRAATARQDMRRAASVYLELVALERAADAGTNEALDRAANIGTSTQFVAIREALFRAHLAGQPPWQGLADLGAATGVPELGDLADITRTAGESGAAIYVSLRARASSLRTQILTAATAKANAASEHMVVPVALLGLTFMLLVGYPAFARILFG
ncbi:type II secretion system F family protein [Pengzhenrongella sicca]|uniref:Type II secretion system F family protein n=1 Tax=Pengzhenrongella sicca TaxID=2819238 RepID=A0A8A4ZGG8_9MICO|nr:type II secretion system F family protein [Pengzhenrongella sicca]QTE30043.1 type II secretion system F family protein [Pengzhenrongella sicca]